MEKYLEQLKEIGLVKVEVDEITPYIEIRLTGDCNDADYNTRSTKWNISTDEERENLKEFLDFIKKYEELLFSEHFIGEPESFESDEYTEDELFGIVEELSYWVCIPSDDVGYCHTLTDMDIYFVNSKQELIPLRLINE